MFYCFLDFINLAVFIKNISLDYKSRSKHFKNFKNLYLRKLELPFYSNLWLLITHFLEEI